MHTTGKIKLNKTLIFYYFNYSEYITALMKWLKINKPKFFAIILMQLLSTILQN